MTESGIPSFNPAAIESGAAKMSSRKDHAEILVLPKSLRDLPRAGIIRGEITESAPDGRVTVRTDQGAIELRVDQSRAYQEGETVEIRLPPGDPPKQAQIRPAPPSTDNTTSSAPARPLAQAEQETPQQHIAIPDPPQPLDPGTTATLKPLNPQALTQITQPYIESLPAVVLTQTAFIAELTVNAVLEALPALNLQIVPSSIPPSVPHETLLFPEPEPPSLPPPLPPETPRLPDGLSAQTVRRYLPLAEDGLILFSPRITETEAPPSYAPLTITIARIAPPGPVLTPPGSPEILPPARPEQQETPAILRNFPETFRAEIVGLTPERHFPVLRVETVENRESRYFALQIPAPDILMGSALELTPQQNSAPFPPVPESLLPAPTIPLPDFAMPGSWPVLQEILQVLAQSVPQAAQAMSNIIPSPAHPAQFGPAALFFLAAVRAGDMTGWLGDKAADALRRAGKADLFSRLTQEIQALNRFAADQPAQDWRALSLPLAWQNEIHKIALYYRREDKSENEKKAPENGGDTRFLINLSLSKIGPVQLDALFKPGAKRLDLILRTEQSFSPPMQADMRRLYKNALDETAITGEISFQGSAKDWIAIAPQSRTGFHRTV